jgi:sugar lactone lactonase YvrE
MALALALWPGAVAAGVDVPTGFSARVYVSGDGFETGTTRGLRGIPSVSTAAIDRTGTLYLARSGRRYSGGDVEDIYPVYRVPPGGATMTPQTERNFLYGPPLPNPQVSAVRGDAELLVTTFDRERRIGVLYRVADGRAELLAGGTPSPGQAALLRQPEGAAVGTDGRIYVADREQGFVLRFDPAGRVLDRQWIGVRHPRVLAADRSGVWIGADGEATAPWQQGPGEVWHVTAEGAPRLVLRGPVPQGIAVSPGGHLFVSDRHAARVFALTSTGRRIDLARFTDGDAPRGLVFAPVTPETQRAGIAGDLFVIVINRGAWPMNEVVRISGPFDGLVGRSE